MLKQNEGLRVAPFAHTDDYGKNVDRAGDDPHCIVCGRKLKTIAGTIHLIEGGFVALHPDDEGKYVSDGGDMYNFPVGPECARKYKGFLTPT